MQFKAAMLSLLSAIRPGYLLVGAAVATGVYATRDAGNHPVTHTTPAPAEVAAPRTAALPALAAADDSGNEVPDDSEDPGDDDTLIGDDEEMRGLAEIEDPAEFAMVFSVGGTSYMRLSREEQASAHGEPEMVIDGSVYSVIAPVTPKAMPASLRKWIGRSVLVEGTCEAKVVGFAEVSRVAGDPPGTENYYYAEEIERGELPQWTIGEIRDANITLAAKLSGCTGTWARASEYPAAKIATVDSDADLDLQAAAMDEVLASVNADGSLDEQWQEMGGEGDWRSAVTEETDTFVHPDTGEKWVFARVYRAGGCGDFGVSQMSAFHVGDDGKLHHVANLDYAGEDIKDVVDIDGDGQPELVMGSTDNATLVDLKNTSHDSIAVDYYSWGCGC